MTPEELLRAATPDQPDAGEGAATGSGSRRRLSWLRVLLLLAVIAAGSGAAWAARTVVQDQSGAPGRAGHSDFAPYVDVTATPTYPFEGSSATPPGDAVLAFVVSDHEDPCRPSWGGAYSLGEATTSLDLDRRVARLQQLGGEATVSFGGAANSELAIGCTSIDSLAAAYLAVIDRYAVDTIDLDVEGAEASEPRVAARRAQALRIVAADRAEAGRPLHIWLTLPVGPDGLGPDGLEVLRAVLAAGVDVTGVNAMVMDYGASLPAKRTMSAQAELSLNSLRQQVQDQWATAGKNLDDAQAWGRIGATPMIGQNDVIEEVFDLTDARRLVAFAEQHGLRRLSMWSANRDQGCGPNYPDLRVVADGCSGLDQSPGDFTAILGRFGTAPRRLLTSPQGESASADPDPEGRNVRPDVPAPSDDPKTSPYPIWNSVRGYTAGTKVVWHRNVFRAKWFTQGEVPDAPVAEAYLTPWVLLGPVLPGERPAARATLPPGTYPEWRRAKAYPGGSKVLLKGVPYVAKWWSQGERPDTITQSPYDGAWRPLLQEP